MIPKKTNSVFLRRASDISQYDRARVNWLMEGMHTSSRRRFFVRALGKCFKRGVFESVLDVGSGTGYLADFFHDKGVRRIVGIEPSIKNARASRHLHPTMKVHQRDLLSFTSKQNFSAAVCVMAIEHIVDLDVAFQKLRTLLIPNGSFFLIIGDKKHFLRERPGKKCVACRINREEAIVMTEHSFGTLYDILRTPKFIIGAARRNRFVLKSHYPLKPSARLIHEKPKYAFFKNTPIFHLLVFKSVA